ncbi:MAG: hypothetical protein IH889_10605, partial [Planctomycetes bacterium]|nr:hypothetical protein [Planctomycetota bacterium]
MSRRTVSSNVISIVAYSAMEPVVAGWNRWLRPSYRLAVVADVAGHASRAADLARNGELDVAVGNRDVLALCTYCHERDV